MTDVQSLTHTLPIPQGRSFDLVCLGRLAVDLYAQQIGSSLEDATSFARYLGGSSANIAFGAARLGLRTAMISRVGDEQMGRSLREALMREGCDVSQIQTDAQRLTGLVLLGIKDRETFPLLFYRENCADMALDATQIDGHFIAQCRALLITGTHLSTPTVQQASEAALGYAAQYGVLRVLDIDYRPVLWGLTKPGEGANRYVADEAVTARLQAMLPHFDLLIGTEEEFLIAGGVPGDLMASLRALRCVTAAAMVVKLGAAGCCFIPGAVPARIADTPTAHGEKVEVLNVLGAGDAFAAGLLSGLLDGMDFQAAARQANACGAIVVSRHACSAAMPTRAELEHWFSGSRHPKVDADAQLAHLHRTTAARYPRPSVAVLAFDHRSQFADLAREAGSNEDRLPALKQLLVKATAEVEASHALQGRVGVLIDGFYGADALAAATGRGWFVGRPVELPLSRPLHFDQTASVASQLVTWPAEHVVKCLVYYHPDDTVALRLEQEAQLHTLWEATRVSGHELLLELVPPAESGSGERAAALHDELVLRSIQRLYNLGFKPEWWKLAPLSPPAWERLACLIAERDPYCRGVVILGLNQPLDYLAKSFAQARNPIIKGFMVGRTLWVAPSLRWLQNQIDDDTLVGEVASNFRRLVEAWDASHPAMQAH